MDKKKKNAKIKKLELKDLKGVRGGLAAADKEGVRTGDTGYETEKCECDEIA
jgi:hypothetical protein